MSRRRQQDGNGEDGERVWEAKVRGREIRLTREEVIQALRGVEPGPVKVNGVQVGGRWYPVKQAISVAARLPRAAMNSWQARRGLEILGFPLSEKGHPWIEYDDDGRPELKPGPDFIRMIPQESFWLEIEPIYLAWCWWEWWTDLRDGYRGGAQVEVPHMPGVYEVKVYGEEPLLYIGRATDLFARVKSQLVHGFGPHEAGRKMEKNEDLSRLVVRWADTKRPAAAEEELLRQHVKAWGAMPKYSERV